MKLRATRSTLQNQLKAKRELAESLHVDIRDLPWPHSLTKRQCKEQQGIINTRMEQAGFDYTGQPRQRPENCECDNTHEQNNTCCMPCWNAGFRVTPIK